MKTDQRATVLAFAQSELHRYLAVMVGSTQAADCMQALRLTAGDDTHDAIWIDVRHCRGVIRGSNPRSLLIAVYRMLREAGCRFIKPGRDGEIIPAVSSSAISVRLHEAASYSCRGLCIEGANSLENVADMIDFLPKLGMNTYYIQFKTPHTFFDKWYNHDENPYIQGFPVTPAEVDRFTGVLRQEIARRGLLYHAVGHGWTTGMLGEDGFGWESRGKAIDYQFQPYAALINGKQQFHRGVPLDTNLCYSSPAVLQHIANEAREFVAAHPDVDVLHLWLADNYNNFCECPDCAKMRPADYYIRLLNEVERAVTAENSEVKICFLAYFDLLWAPQREKLCHPERFMFLFAPISRTYQQAFFQGDDTGPVRHIPFELNRLSLPKSPREHLPLLEEWREYFTGDAILFDYHYMWYGYFDLGDTAISRVLAADIESLEEMGFCGMISCQANRAGMPSGLGLQVLAHKLWNKNASFDSIAQRYFIEAFGTDAKPVQEFLERLSALCFPPMLREKVKADEQQLRAFNKLYDLVEEFEHLVLRRIKNSTGTAFRCWNLLQFTVTLARVMKPLYVYHATGNRSATLIQWEKVKTFAQLAEKSIQQDFDVYLFIVSMERALDLRPQYE